VHAILTPVGSAGDVNPFVILGRDLRLRGHRVTLTASEPFASIAAAAGLEFLSLATAADFERVANNPDLWHSTRGVKIILDEVAVGMRRAYDAIAALYEPGETMLVGHALSFFTRVLEETRHAPAATVHLAPGIFRSDFRQPALPNGADLSWWPRWAKRALWWSVDRFALDPLIAPALNGWRAELGLSPVSRVFGEWMHSPQRVIGLFPEWFADPQPDWPPQLRLAGFALSDPTVAPAGVETEHLDRFLAAGAPPIVLTAGSANRHAAAFFRTALEAAADLGRRAVCVTAHAADLPSPLPGGAFHANYAPFSTLFPRAAAVVHHGGIGTSAQALAAGAPQLVVPIGFDQPDNAARLVRLGVAAAIPSRRFTRARAASALSRLLADVRTEAACRRWRTAMDSPTAVARAGDLIEEQFVRASAARTAHRS
jgi:UDP:flavonoid glycosyltransferase YjiC (YdhE family)